jgi:hypothetical protein
MLLCMKRELDDMMVTLTGLFRWDVLPDERFGLRAALRVECRRVMSLGGRCFHPGAPWMPCHKKVRRIGTHIFI